MSATCRLIEWYAGTVAGAERVTLLVVFLIGFVREGETLVSRGIGVGAALAVAAAVIVQWTRRRAASSVLVEG